MQIPSDSAGDPSGLYLGIDLGTSGCRAVAIDASASLRAIAAVTMSSPARVGAAVEQDPHVWWQAVRQALDALWARIDARRVRALAVDGTSGTLLLADAEGQPLTPALMYNDARAAPEADRIARLAPRDTAAYGRTSALAKLLYLQAQDSGRRARHCLSQADWIAGQLTGTYGITDSNNALKLGYDPVAGRWPDWLTRLNVRRALLPAVVSPGTPIGTLRADICTRLGLAQEVTVVAGTTDSTASVLATGAARPGEAVTALGSTLVMKVVCERPVFAPEYGVYSQPLGARWLAGGGSNSGGAVLRHYFSDAQLAALTPLLRPAQSTDLDYYPLPAPGERFPLNDPALPPRLTPRPMDDIAFLQGLLEGMARIEHQAYLLLARLGAPYPVSVRSTGGGAGNPAWTEIRARLLNVPVFPAAQHEAAYGTALLAREGARPAGGTRVL